MIKPFTIDQIHNLYKVRIFKAAQMQVFEKLPGLIIRLLLLLSALYSSQVTLLCCQTSFSWYTEFRTQFYQDDLNLIFLLRMSLLPLPLYTSGPGRVVFSSSDYFSFFPKIWMPITRWKKTFFASNLSWADDVSGSFGFFLNNVRYFIWRLNSNFQ